MMRRLFLIILSISICQALFAQVINSDDDPVKGDTIRILENIHEEQDPRLSKILGWHIENNKKRDGIRGYRVEIYFSSDMKAKENAFKQKVKFLSKYPEYDVHVKYVAPNFKVRVGDFRTKNEALKLEKKIKKDYPGAFIVPDIIEFPLLKQQHYE